MHFDSECTNAVCRAGYPGEGKQGPNSPWGHLHQDIGDNNLSSKRLNITTLLMPAHSTTEAIMGNRDNFFLASATWSALLLPQKHRKTRHSLSHRKVML